MSKKFHQYRSLRKIGRENPKIWLLEDRGVGYIQIPKVATRSIRAAFTKSILESRGQAVNYETLKEATIDAIKQESTHSVARKNIRTQYPDLFLFSFIRDPIERLYSCYKNKVIAPLANGERNVLAKHGIELGILFDEFVERVCEIADDQADRHIRSQSWFITYNDELLVGFVV